jgi:hypothetical protein
VAKGNPIAGERSSPGDQAIDCGDVTDKAAGSIPEVQWVLVLWVQVGDG